MAVIKNKKTGCWEVRTYYKTYSGEQKQKTKRGFQRKSEALKWEEDFKASHRLSLDMPFSNFVELYLQDISPRLKASTLATKLNIIQNKLIPFFGDMKMCEIDRVDVIKWQNEMLSFRDSNGKGYSKQYLRTMQNQLSAILNHAVNLYDLKYNVARKAGSIGSKTENISEAKIWTPEEFLKFSEAVADKPYSYYAFQILFHCGLRVGELLALTREDFDLEKKVLHITKNFQHTNGVDYITTPKTPQSVRDVFLPNFLVKDLGNFFSTIYGLKPTDRLFNFSKAFLHKELSRGAAIAGIHRITIHQLRHSHISHLIHLGYSAVDIAGRVGHSAQEITFRYAHEFPSVQSDIVNSLDEEMSKQVEKEADTYVKEKP
ncbi:MAG: site-specific integrase [Clostridiales bacterium]|nr:site-specific integrase [Clostridiales bacterium]